MDDVEATAISGFSRESTIQDHLMHLDDGINDDEDDDDEDVPMPTLEARGLNSDFDDNDDDEDDDEVLPRPALEPPGPNDNSDDEDEDTEESEQEEDETPFFAHVVKYAVDELLDLGLHCIGYTERRIKRAKYATNVERFKAHYGSIPKVLLVWR